MPGQYQGAALFGRHCLNFRGKAFGERLDLTQAGLVHALVATRVDRQRQIQALFVEPAPVVKCAAAGPGERAQQHMVLALIGLQKGA